MMDSEVILSGKKSINGQKSSKVLVQLRDMYTSGFSAYSPTRPLLNARTMQAFYGLSFIIYFAVIASDWMYLYFLLRGYIASFPLRTWMAVAFVSSVVIATMLVCLLIVLCIENAFAQPNDVTEFSVGCAAINEAFTEWLQVKHWPVALICSTTLASVYWRLVLLYFAYRRMICPLKKNDSVSSALTKKSFIERFRDNFDSSNPRLDEYDECWPVRFAYNILYKNPNQRVHCNGKIISHTDQQQSKEVMTTFLQKIWKWTKQLFGVLICVTLTLMLYLFYVVTLCFPCCYHYGLRSKSSSDRHTCAQAFVMYFSRVFHFTMFVFSLITAVVLIFLNASLLLSAHAVGNNAIPFEIKELCLEIDVPAHTIVARFDSDSLEGVSNSSVIYKCKPIWDDGGMELGFKRREAGPWQTRVEISKHQLLVISTLVSMDYSDRDRPNHRVYYDFALLKKADPYLTGTFLCYKDIFTKWKFKEEVAPMRWPYFEGCDNTWTLHKEILIRCLHAQPLSLLYL